jgi:excisionase family DNA binding protein
METENIELLNVQLASRFLGMTVRTIRRWAQTGKLKGLKVGSRGDWRFTKQNLLTMIKKK